MRRVLFGLLVLALIAPIPASAEVTSGLCTPSTTQLEPIASVAFNARYWDPILHPGVIGYPRAGPDPFKSFPGPAHWHNFFGNTSLDENGIGEPDAPTSCTGGFRGAFWTPSVVVYGSGLPEEGLRPDARSLSYRIRTPPRAVAPSGLGIVSHHASWDCGPGSPKTETPHLCSSGTVQAVIVFPRWWNGTDLHLDNEAHVSFSKVPGWKRLPALRARVDFGFGTTFGGMGFDHVSVNGSPISVRNPDGTFEVLCREGPGFRCEDEHSMHADVLYP